MVALRAFLVLPLASAAVYELTADNFDRLVFRPSNTAAFVKFYAPWCGHCQKLAPDWRKVEKAHGKSSMLIGSVDCSDGPAQPGGQGGRNVLCDTYKAMSLPTLMYFTAGSKRGFTFEGNKTAEDLIAFAEELGNGCSLSKPEACTVAQRALLHEYAELGASEVKEKAQAVMMEVWRPLAGSHAARTLHCACARFRR